VSLENEKAIRSAYQIAGDKDIAGWVVALTEVGTFTHESIDVVYRASDELSETDMNHARPCPDLHRALVDSGLAEIGDSRVFLRPLGERDKPRIVTVEFQNIGANVIEEFCSPDASVVVALAGYSSESLRTFQDAKEGVSR